jgi:tetratricopeptide (TPR) repeat protein
LAGCINYPLFNRDGGSRILDSQAAGTQTPDLPLAKKVECCLKVAEAEERDGKLDQAIAQFELARQHDPNAKNVARRLAVLYDKKGAAKKALAEYQKALAETPRDADVITNLGYHYYNQGQWTAAEKQYRKALAINPNHKYAWNNLGLALGQQNRYDESLKAFEKVVSPAEAHSNLAFVLTTQGKRVEAKQEYQKAIDLDSSFTDARTRLNKLLEADEKARTGANNRAAKLSLQPAADTAAASQLPQVPPAPEMLPVPEKVNLLPMPERTLPAPPPPDSTPSLPHNAAIHSSGSLSLPPVPASRDNS